MISWCAAFMIITLYWNLQQKEKETSAGVLNNCSSKHASVPNWKRHIVRRSIEIFRLMVTRVQVLQVICNIEVGTIRIDYN